MKPNTDFAKYYTLYVSLIFSVLFFSGLVPAFAQPSERDYAAEARKILSLPEQEIRPLLETLSAEDADSILSHVRHIKRDAFPEIDKTVLIVQQLENVKATHLADRRLRHLVLVFVTLQLLFCGLFLYLIFDQRKILRSRKPTEPPTKAQVFSGS